MSTESDTPSPNAVVIQILIADGDVGIVELLQRMVAGFATRNRRFEFHTADSIAKTLAILKRERFDVILLDLNMTDGVDAVELIRQIRQQEREGGIERLKTRIVCTTYHNSDREKLASTAGADRFIYKPFDAREVRMKLQRTL